MTSRLRIAKAMRNAVSHLARNRTDGNDNWFMNEFICHAIEDANQNLNLFSRLRYTDAAIRAKSTIHRRLEGCGTLDSWLIKKGIPSKDLTYERVQAHRHKWLKQLIKEYETM